MDIQIPPELVQLIIKASLGPYDFSLFGSDDHLPRYTTLKSFSLVDSSWRDFTNPLLYEYVVIRTANASVLFLEMCEEKGEEMKEVRSMRVEGSLGFNRAARLLECVPELENLALHMVDLDVQDLAPAQKLNRLFLDSLSFSSQVDFAPPFSLPRLAHFHCTDVNLRSSSTPFFNPTFTPALRAVSLHRISAASLVELDQGFAQCIPSLHHLSVDSPHVYGTVLPTAANLRLLDVCGSWGLPLIMHYIKVAPRFLRVYDEGVYHGLQVVNIVGSLKAEGVWPAVDRVFVDCDSTTMDPRLDGLIRQRNPQLNFERMESIPDTMGFWRAVEKVNSIVQKEQDSAR